jgi:hypothetical protein
MCLNLHLAKATLRRWQVAEMILSEAMRMSILSTVLTAEESSMFQSENISKNLGIHVQENQPVPREVTPAITTIPPPRAIRNLLTTSLSRATPSPPTLSLRRATTDIRRRTTSKLHRLVAQGGSPQLEPPPRSPKPGQPVRPVARTQACTGAAGPVGAAHTTACELLRSPAASTAVF